MTDILITCDTELSAGLHQRGASPDENVRSSIHGEVPAGRFGIGWQMDCMDAHGLRGVFFIDPMPTLVYGRGFLDEVVAAVLGRGHEVQLHIHTEWLQWAPASPVGNRRGQNIGDFTADDQETLLSFAADTLVAAGAPPPTAFRAGNYGADERTLAVLARLGFKWDSSFNAALPGKACRIDLPSHAQAPVKRSGVVELPIGAIRDRPGSVRAAQVCALSSREMEAALRHAIADEQPAFVVVNHSFEMLSRDRRRPNRLAVRRFRSLCELVGSSPGVRGLGFDDLDPGIADLARDSRGLLEPSLLRTGERMIQQAAGNLLYERSLRPAA
jgi:peptidoglycan/xylan/chitin deacetylase (PgdA/CDA1 family)